ncbi:nitrous oxide reductase accessory protein NosL [Solibacillus sp. FSL R7-0668]|uniref:nitrous oxide reductase accessory protein NosL n=1 Tax=Solibacillus sp. FSL R7-0668 TaxID=2921688 RepID=UPI0030F97A6E
MKKRFLVFLAVMSIYFVSSLVFDERFVIQAAAPTIQKDIPKDTYCEVCNMVVYRESHKMGKFSAKAITSKGKTLYYDDIGCLVFDETRTKTTNTKYVRDYHSSKWISVDTAIIVKSNLKSPMNWGYIYFSTQKQANAYLAKNKKAKIVALSTIKEEATKRYQNQFGEKRTDKKISAPTAASSKTSLSQDVPNHTDCAFCNMVVYKKDSPFGKFSAQAIQKSGKVRYYDDISCLLYNEVKDKASNAKYVRDYTTMNWIVAEKATYVKTTLQSPMDDGYVFFAKAEDAKKYVAKNKGTKIVTFQAVKKEAIQRYK